MMGLIGPDVTNNVALYLTENTAFVVVVNIGAGEIEEA